MPESPISAAEMADQLAGWKDEALRLRKVRSGAMWMGLLMMAVALCGLISPNFSSATALAVIALGSVLFTLWYWSKRHQWTSDQVREMNIHFDHTNHG